MEIFAAVVGVILGFLLSEIAQWLRASRADAKDIQSARAFIALEIQHNLSVLAEIKQSVIGDNPDQENNALLHRCYRFVSLPFPEFHDRAFLTQMSIISSSLDAQTATSLLRHYDKINTLTSLRQKMEEAKSRQDHAWLVASGGRNSVRCDDFGSGPSIPFDQSINSFWKQLDLLLTDIGQNGNPMK